ncbi:MAG TPA: Rieske 2Fe-2S domain-containing protein [Egibacteraceae bacterium]|nr:Rieske 2Fe-2S domain-containing protein [Egibacteraceae bacterium]
MSVLEDLAERLGRNAALDRVVGPLDRALRPVLDRRPVKDALSGTWLGHRLHPLVMVVPLGSLISSGVLDLFGGEEAEAAADRLLGVAVASAVPTAAAGLSDWLHTDSGGKRVGVVHAAWNTTAVALAVASLRARAAGNRRRGKALAMLGLAAVGSGGYLGGHLSYAMGVGVNHSAFVQGPSDWTDVAAVDDLPEGRAVRATAGDAALMLVREGERIHALADRCGHLGCSLADGAVREGVVECGCHGSRFRLADGKAVGGPAAASQASYETRVRDGRVEIRERMA